MGSAEKYECPGYESVRGSKSPRCRHYRRNGQCAREGALYCLEWLKKNNLEEDRDLFGKPTLKKAKRGKKTTVAPEEPTDQNHPCVRNITEEQVQSFKELGAEVCISSPDTGDIWIVPAYSDSERREISAEHAATLAVILSAFPGAKVTAFERSAEAPPSPPSNPSPTEASP